MLADVQRRTTSPDSRLYAHLRAELVTTLSVMTNATYSDFGWTRGSWVPGTNAGSKLFVTLGFVLSLHFVQ
jgi:hypothetical protein